MDLEDVNALQVEQERLLSSVIGSIDDLRRVVDSDRIAYGDEQYVLRTLGDVRRFVAKLREFPDSMPVTPIRGENGIRVCIFIDIDHHLALMFEEA